MPIDSAPPTAPSGLVNKDGKSTSVFGDADYNPVESNWYTAKPYGFKFTPRSGNAVVMFLPISPSNLSVTTHFATTVVPTLYGTVEEHSPVRYYDITIEGTTGMGPKYVHPFNAGEVAIANTGRTAFSVQWAPPSHILGFFSNTLTRAQNLWYEGKSLKQGAINAITGSTLGAETGLKLDQTGYLAFHNLYRFLLKYKKDAAGVDDNRGMKRSYGVHPLIFFNYKDNNQYKVVVKTMTLRRDAQDPMMYHYSISMRGYDLETAGTPDDKSQNEANDMLKNLGLSGVSGSPLLGEARKLSERAKTVLSSVANGIHLLGR